MARLDDLLPELKDLNFVKKNNESNKVSGVKRRAWISEDLNETLISQKGSIDHVYKPELIQMKIDNLGLKGSVDSVYKLESLGFNDLRSNPLKLFHYLYELKKNEDDFCKTPRVRLSDMMKQLNLSKDSVRTALRFLLKQKFITRIEFRPGKLGWSRYQLKEIICKELELSNSKGFINHFELDKTQYNFKTNDVKIENKNEDTWDVIDTSSLENIGFNKKHLLQIKMKSTPDIVQESINHFSYALKHNNKVKEYPNPVATLISVLKRGEAWIEPNYQSPQELAQKKILEIKKIELERKKNLEEEIYKIAFDEWKQGLNQIEIDKIAPDLRRSGDLTPPLVKLSNYFKENIWPNTKKNFHVD